MFTFLLLESSYITEKSPESVICTIDKSKNMRLVSITQEINGSIK